MKKLVIFILLAVVLLSINSCSFWKQRYLKDISLTKPDSVSLAVPPDYRVKINDILSIKIFSYNKDVNELFNAFQQTTTNSQQIYNEANAYFNGYIVSDSGYVKLPVIGNVYIKDKKIEEVKTIVGEKLNNYVKDADVFVKLLLFKVTILGEVSAPGLKYIYSNRLSALEAIALAGSITDVGNKKNILIVRSTDKGVLTYRIDLTDPKILSSSNFYILPNDIIYIEPRKAKALQVDLSTVSLIVSMLTTTILLVNLFKPIR